MAKTNAQRKAERKPGARPKRRQLVPVGQPCEVRFTFDSEQDRDTFLGLIRPIFRDHGYGIG